MVTYPQRLLAISLHQNWPQRARIEQVVLQTWIATDLARGMRFASPDTAFYEVAQRAGGSGLRLIMILATVTASAAANAMAAQAAVAGATPLSQNAYKVRLAQVMVERALREALA